MAKDQLARYRRAVDEDLPGEQLDGILDRLDEAGYDIGGDQLATKPRGFTTDHPRLDLLRHKAIHVRRDFGDPDWLATPAALDEVRECWEGLRPLAQWLAQHVGQTDEERR
ncbi:hypothetical protein GCM10025862_09000 [Arsenicicoccus piscis]|uniref:DUF2461 domain-containing protein n=2 Tax=Arsenicicoccus piscis TaxID=673954 RepID=A0ABQ6HK83_9MICO|nr:hypothetical protein GCM10025862_09000 [Arsenicicoccus piscis]